jgi:hypothetical protein
MKQVIRKMILESIASDLVNAGFKTWKYTDENGESFFPKGRNAKEAALYLKLKYKLQNIDVSRIEPHSGLGYADNTTIDIYNQRYQPTDENKKSNKMKVTQLKQIIREEIQKVMKENDLDSLDLSPREKREFPERKANLIKRNPQFAKLSDQEILDMIRDHDREYELMTREMPDEF